MSPKQTLKKHRCVGIDALTFFPIDDSGQYGPDASGPAAKMGPLFNIASLRKGYLMLGVLPNTIGMPMNGCTKGVEEWK